jgi:predicted deacylase
LIVIPIVNAFGFINHSRYLPDRRDLNRSFPGSAGGSLASRLAHLFLTEFVARCDLGIDLHSAAIHRTNLPQVRISPDNAKTAELAEVFGAPVILESPLREGSLRGAAKEIGKDVLLFEAGEGLRFDEMSVRSGVTGILRVLRHLDMLPAKGIAKPKAPAQYCASSKWLRAPVGGLLRTFRADGDVVATGDLMAAVSEPFGEHEEEIRAPFGGIIVGRAVMPIVNEGDAVFHLARVKSVMRAEEMMVDLNVQLTADPLFDEDEII